MANKTATKLPDTLAAVDLGSNSFRMVIARMVNGRIYTLDRLREPVRLAAGLTKKNQLTKAAQQRALACLRRFGQRLRGMPVDSVRAVSTNTLRLMQNSGRFLNAAQQALGYPVEIISGQEEARLIYLGVAQGLPNKALKRLVIDIGGGSTEVIIGQGMDALRLESLQMGCVSGSLDYFPHGIINAGNFHHAEIAALQDLQAIATEYRKLGWRECIGASGTIRAILNVTIANGWGNEITLGSLRKLRKHLLTAGDLQRVKLAGLRSDRVAVFPGGVAILLAMFEGLGIERMTASEYALREGVLYDLLGRIRHDDIRDDTINTLCARYPIDLQQAARVEKTALACLQQAAKTARPPSHTDTLRWAARLHEIGLAVSHSQYQKHGAYLIENSDLPGFSRQDQQFLSTLILGQRGKVPIPMLKELPKALTDTARQLCIALRLAVLLNRSRSAQQSPKFVFKLTAKTLRLKFPRGWLNQHPLTQADLEQEAKYLKAIKIQLRIE